MATIAEPMQDFTILPDLPADVFTAPLQKPAHVGDDWLEPAQTAYSTDDDAIWNDLFARQLKVLPGRAASAFMQGLEKLDLGRGGVPEFGRLSEELGELTGWSVVPVPMLIPDHVFFWHLANRRFPAGNFIRTRETFDYIQEPDVFHDVFGHVPMLTDPVQSAKVTWGTLLVYGRIRTDRGSARRYQGLWRWHPLRPYRSGICNRSE